MVKGTARQVVLVKTPDTKIFEQAIFILREDALETQGMSDEDILRQAQETAGSYVTEQVPKKRRAWLKNSLWCLLGAALATLVFIGMG